MNGKHMDDAAITGETPTLPNHFDREQGDINSNHAIDILNAAIAEVEDGGTY